MAEEKRAKTVAVFGDESDVDFVADLLHSRGFAVTNGGPVLSPANSLPAHDLAIAISRGTSQLLISQDVAEMYGPIRVLFTFDSGLTTEVPSSPAEFASSATFKSPEELSILVRRAIRDFIADPISATVARESLADRAADVDALGFEPYVEAVAEFLRTEQTKPPLTMSIEGSWGSGKSSFMLQLKKYLADRGGLTIAFNAWRYDKAEELWAAFALQFLRDLRHRFSLSQRLRRGLKLFLLRVNEERALTDIAIASSLVLIGIVAWLTLHVLGFAAIAVVGLAWIGRAGKKISATAKMAIKRYLRAPDYDAKLAFLTEFERDLPRVIKAMVDEGQKVFIFIDDLDRCDVPHAADLMQAINLMISDQGPLIFIMGIDREKVAAGIAVKNEKLLPYLSLDTPKKDRVTDSLQGIVYGYEFIEKFIQVPFVLPEPTDADIEHLLTGRKRAADTPTTQPTGASTAAPAANTFPTHAHVTLDLGKDAPIFLEVAKMVAPALDRNPRRIKQFVNLFRLRALIADATGLFRASASTPRSKRLTLHKLGKFVAIELRWPLLLAHLERDPKFLAELERIAIDGGATENPFAAYWSDRPQLLALLRSGCVDADGHRDDEGMTQSSLANIDVFTLLRVSPAVKTRRVKQTDEPPTPNETPFSTADGSDGISARRDWWRLFASVGAKRRDDTTA